MAAIASDLAMKDAMRDEFMGHASTLTGIPSPLPPRVDRKTMGPPVGLRAPLQGKTMSAGLGDSTGINVSKATVTANSAERRMAL
jgi:hypothetical protein